MQNYLLQNVSNNENFKAFKFEPQKKNAQIAPQEFQQQDDSFEKTPKNGKMKKAAPLIGAILGTVLPIIAINKMEGKTLNLKEGKFTDKLKSLSTYFEIDEVKRILITGATSVLGGMAGGFIADKDPENRKEKLKEGIFETVNVTTPTLLSAVMLKTMQSKGLDKGFAKILPFAVGVGAGIPLGAKISGAIKQKLFPEDKQEQRKFHPRDFLVHSDDAIDALVLLKLPFAKKLQIDKLLALIYIKCGYEAGSIEKKDKTQNEQ